MGARLTIDTLSGIFRRKNETQMINEFKGLFSFRYIPASWYFSGW